MCFASGGSNCASECLGHLVGVGHMHDVERRLLRPRLDRDARDQRGIVAADVVEPDAGGVLEDLEQRQAFLLVGRGIDRQRPFLFGGGEQRRIQPGARLLGLRRQAAGQRQCGETGKGASSRNRHRMLSPPTGDLNPPHRGLNSALKVCCHFRSSSDLNSVGTTVFACSRSTIPGGLVAHVAAGRQAAKLGEVALPVPAQHEIGGEPRGVRALRLGVHRNAGIEQDHRIEREDFDRAAGELHIARQHHVVVERQPILAGADRTGEREVPVGDHRLERADHALDDLRRLRLTEVLEEALEPIEVGAVDGDLAGPFFLVRELLVALRQRRGADHLGVVGRRVVVGVDAIPAPVRIARGGVEVLGLGRFILREHLLRQFVRRMRKDHVEGALAGTRLDHRARHQHVVAGADVVHLDSGRVLEDFEQRQALALVGRGIDDDRAFLLGRRQQGRVEPGRRLCAGLRLGKTGYDAEREGDRSKRTRAGSGQKLAHGVPPRPFVIPAA